MSPSGSLDHRGATISAPDKNTLRHGPVITRRKLVGNRMHTRGAVLPADGPHRVRPGAKARAVRSGPAPGQTQPRVCAVQPAAALVLPAGHGRAAPGVRGRGRLRLALPARHRRTNLVAPAACRLVRRARRTAVGAEPEDAAPPGVRRGLAIAES